MHLDLNMYFLVIAQYSYLALTLILATHDKIFHAQVLSLQKTSLRAEFWAVGSTKSTV